MKKKIFIQILLVFLIICFSYIVYNKYFYTVKNDGKLIDENSIVKNYDSNIINNINYKSSDLEGRTYSITAESGSIDDLNNQIIKMKKVVANIDLKDNTSIEITSDFARYNTITYKTKFISNVTSKYLDHNIVSELLVIDFDKNILEAVKKMTYKNSNTILKADKLELNLLTKDLKVLNFDDKNGPDINNDNNVEIKFSNK